MGMGMNSLSLVATDTTVLAMEWVCTTAMDIDIQGTDIQDMVTHMVAITTTIPTGDQVTMGMDQ